MEDKGPSLLECFEKAPFLLMEGTLGERLKREYGLQFDEQVAMAQTGLPYLISFTIRENGCLIDGTPIHLAIRAIDAAVFPVPLGYMTNCVHPSILRRALSQPVNRTDLVRRRFCGIQANTSPLPYEQLDQAQELYTSSPQNLAGEMAALHREFGLRLFGGCRGTDGGHLRELVRQLGKEPPFAENSVSTGRTGS